MHRGVQAEVKFHIPLQFAQNGSNPTNPPGKPERIGDLIREHVPMSGRRFGVGPIRPEFRQHPGEVTPFYAIRRIGLPGDRIHGVAFS